VFLTDSRKLCFSSLNHLVARPQHEENERKTAGWDGVRKVDEANLVGVLLGQLGGKSVDGVPHVLLGDISDDQEDILEAAANEASPRDGGRLLSTTCAMRSPVRSKASAEKEEQVDVRSRGIRGR
jgi:hypothetical protein